mmetsp:Transcript_73917/g.190763  ORF Transcript_73917/g.190763 Transcript_73917/m.190763 type:complete len:192 (+) Transcript_73917:143-718(+)
MMAPGEHADPVLLGTGGGGLCSSSPSSCNSLSICGLGKNPAGASKIGFVGSGKGEYIQERSYQYVGPGQGAFTAPTQPPSNLADEPTAATNWCLFIAGFLCFLAVVFLIVLVLVPGPEAPTTSLRGTVAEPTAATHNCEVGTANWQQVWSEEKKEFCCHNVGRGCPLPSAAPAATPSQPPPPPPGAVAVAG